jgi:hypothetical protein
MSYVNANPQMMADAAGNLASIGSTINTANASAAAGTSGVKAPGGDPVSAFISALFAAHAQIYQAAGAQAAKFHDQFVQTLREGAASYARAEAANATPLHTVPGVHSGPSRTPTARHMIGNGAKGERGAGQHGAAGRPLPASGATTGPSGGNVGGGGLGASGGDAHAAPIAGTQGGNAGGGGADGVRANVGGESGAGGGGAGVVVDSGAAGGGAVNASAPPAWGPAVAAAPTAPVLPGFAPAPGASAVMAGGYPAAAGLAGLGAGGFSGDSAFGGMGEPAAAAASSAAAPGLAAAQPAIPTAPKAQSVQPGNQAHSGDPAHPGSTHHDIPALLTPLPRLRLRGLREKLHLRSGLRDKSEWQKELREAAESKPWGREELLSALGLRPPGY